MRIDELIPLLESPESQKLGHVINAANKASKSLSYDAKKAIEDWQYANWDRSKMQQSYHDKDGLFHEIQQAFEPVKSVLKQLFGDTIRLHRGQRHIKDEDKSQNRPLFSFSFDEQVAKDFAHGKLDKESSEEDIDAAVKQFERTGFTTFRGQKFKKTDNPKYYNIYDRRNDFVTDGVVAQLRDDLAKIAQHATSYNDERRARGSVHTIDVPIDKIFWVTNDLNSKEFIVALNPLEQ